MPEIGLKGVLEGVGKLLTIKEDDTEVELKSRINCASDILDGVIKELTPPKTQVVQTLPSSLDPEAKVAKEELR